MHKASWVALLAPGLGIHLLPGRILGHFPRVDLSTMYLFPLAFSEKVLGKKNLKILKRQVSNRRNIQVF